VNICHAALHNIPEDSNVHSYRHQNLTCHELL
jgi:hypothetical protein